MDGDQVWEALEVQCVQGEEMGYAVDFEGGCEVSVVDLDATDLMYEEHTKPCFKFSVQLWQERHG